MEQQVLSSALNSREFRNAVGHFATGITVVTTEHAGIVHGMTANAFMSVSLNPPLVLVSVDQRTHMHSLLAQGRFYGVNILAHDQELLSRHFAGRPQEDLTITFVWKHGVPLITGSIAHLVCEIVEAHPAGDHTLYIGHVKYLDYRGGSPLLYYTGRYAVLQQSTMTDEVFWLDYTLYAERGLGA